MGGLALEVNKHIQILFFVCTAEVNKHIQIFA